MRPSIVALLLLLSFVSACADSSDGTWSPPPVEHPSIKVPEHVWPAAHGFVSVLIDGDAVVYQAEFGRESTLRCEPLLSAGACVAERCMPAPQTTDRLPDAGVVEVRLPSGRTYELVPKDGFYDPIRGKLLADVPPFSISARGDDVPAFDVDIEPPGPLAFAMLPGADPRSAESDLEIAHEPFDADFDLVLRSDGSPRVECSFTGGRAVIPKEILRTMERDRRITADASRVRKKVVRAGDYTVDVVVVRDPRVFAFRLTPAEASSGP